ncbi:hypothetical protein J6TS1_43040 [Siminovitchia terrae]|uniref:Condensation domain-containing protein n=1 Tax=Siminovitchia terrae TaxID=1914933 RepID=A0ABQ4L2L2_SIMTE|nr:condensation domain-containing protein [Siminovitchia terrae]GIN98434.1 hypothetical protein J6TS1_43040 [Siminovitchia terrae]
MSFNLNNIQKKIALFCILNERSRKYEIHATTGLSKEVNINKFRNVLLEVLNQYPIFRYSFNKERFCFSNNREFNISEIGIYNDTKDKDNFFKDPINIYDHRLVKCALVKKEEGFLFLLKIHHIIFDVYSGFLFLDNLFTKYHDEEDIMGNTRPTTKRENTKYYPKKIDDYNFDYLKKHIASNPVQYQFYIADKYRWDKLSIREKSAISIYTIAKLVFKATKKEDLIIGVPVPNREGRKNEMGCFINILPVRVLLQESKGIRFHIKSITKQLFQNLRYQNYDFQSKYRDNLLDGEFPIIYTYYPSDFEYERPSFNMKCLSIDFPEQVSLLHMTMRDDGKVDYVSSLKSDIGDEVKELLLNNIAEYTKEGQV